MRKGARDNGWERLAGDKGAVGRQRGREADEGAGGEQERGRGGNTEKEERQEGTGMRQGEGSVTGEKRKGKGGGGREGREEDGEIQGMRLEQGKGELGGGGGASKFFHGRCGGRVTSKFL